VSAQIELFWISGSPFSWRVQLALALHQIDYVSHRINIDNREQKQPDYLALNPYGKVPVIKEGEFVLRESLAILAYLNTKYSWQLFGSSAAEQGQIWQQICEVEDRTVHFMRKFVRPILLGGLDVKRNEVLAAAEVLSQEFEPIDKILAKQPWLIGDRLTAADISVYPLVKFADRAATREQAAPLNLPSFPLEERFPYIQKWIRQIESLPGAASVYPPHW